MTVMLRKIRDKWKRGFTVLELLIVIAIIGILGLLVGNYLTGAQNRTFFSRTNAEFRAMRVALGQYLLDNGEYPDDVSRDIPPGLEPYLTPSDADRWPDAPYPGSVYDWDAYESDGVDTYQISVRFCDIGQPDTCNFPDEPWAADFDVNSSLYYCLEGNCKAHPARPADHPGYCVNCGDEE